MQYISLFRPWESKLHVPLKQPTATVNAPTGTGYMAEMQAKTGS